ncbi:hypothetical protein [Aureivirga marina]|uniref:hypothetical protein n=1 Tax=Aureivirga marina TaxID=1182451 RepID=UPI0018C975FB|nr:hypothetical protein [Aureivirga marina]
MKKAIYVLVSSVLLFSCGKKEVFKPHDFVGSPTGTEYLVEGIDSLPSYDTHMKLELKDFTINPKTKDTVTATYVISNLMSGILNAWGQKQVYGGEMLLILDHTNPDNPTLDLKQNVKDNLKHNPLSNYILYGGTSSKTEAEVYDFFEVNKNFPNTFSIKDKVIDMNFTHQGWIEKSDYFGNVGNWSCMAKFKKD